MKTIEDITTTIINIRHEHNLSQQQVSQKSDISFGTYRQIESRRRKTITVVELVKITSAYTNDIDKQTTLLRRILLDK